MRSLPHCVIVSKIQDESLRGSMKQLADAIHAIGRQDFGARMMSALAEIAGADMCSAFGFEVAGPFLLIAESTDAAWSPYAQIASLRYASRFWRHDIDTVYALGRASREVMVTRRSARSIRDLEYRSECYVNGNVGERLSIVRTTRRGAVINAYKLTSNGRFSSIEAEAMESNAPVLMAVLERHRDLAADQTPGWDNHTLIVQSLYQLEGVNLSQREAQVLACILMGCTVLAIAQRLALSPTSVATYRQRGYAKLSIRTRMQLRCVLDHTFKKG